MRSFTSYTCISLYVQCLYFMYSVCTLCTVCVLYVQCVYFMYSVCTLCTVCVLYVQCVYFMYSVCTLCTVSVLSSGLDQMLSVSTHFTLRIAKCNFTKIRAMDVQLSSGGTIFANDLRSCPMVVI